MQSESESEKPESSSPLGGLAGWGFRGVHFPELHPPPILETAREP